MNPITSLLGYFFRGSSIGSKTRQNQIDLTKIKRYDVVEHPKYGKGIVYSTRNNERASLFVEFPNDPTKVKFHFFGTCSSYFDENLDVLKYLSSREDEIKAKYNLDLRSIGPIELANIINNPTYEGNQELREIILDKLSEYGENLPKEVIQIIKSVVEKGQYPSDNDICGFTSAIRVAGSSKSEELIPILKNLFKKELELRSEELWESENLVLIETTGALAKIGEKSKTASEVLFGCLNNLVEKIQKEIQIPSMSRPYVETAKGIVKVLSQHELSGQIEDSKKTIMESYIDRQVKSLEELYKWWSKNPQIRQLEKDLYYAEETPRIDKIWEIIQNSKKYPISQEQKGKLNGYLKKQRDYLDSSYIPYFTDTSKLREGADEIDEICKIVKEDNS